MWPFVYEDRIARTASGITSGEVIDWLWDAGGWWPIKIQIRSPAPATGSG